MKYILMILPAAAIVCGIFTGRLPEVSAAVLESASGAVTLALTLCGSMALWSWMNVIRSNDLKSFINVFNYLMTSTFNSSLMMAS